MHRYLFNLFNLSRLMAKRIIMIPPFDVLTGNLSGKQDLKYAENDNPAYEAPNGSQSARNYTTRYVGARRADGKTYFSIKTKSTTVLNGVTRLQMALTGSIAAIRSAVMALPAAGSGRKPWDTIQAAYEYYKNENPGEKDAKSLQAYFDARVRPMLINKRTSIEFNAHPGGYTLTNPFALASSSALQIKQSIWVKFADLFMYEGNTRGGYHFTIDGKTFVASNVTGGDLWLNLPGEGTRVAPNYVVMVTGIAVQGAGAVLYNDQPVYLGSTAVQGSDVVDAGGKYSVYQA